MILINEQSLTTTFNKETWLLAIWGEITLGLVCTKIVKGSEGMWVKLCWHLLWSLLLLSVCLCVCMCARDHNYSLALICRGVRKDIRIISTLLDRVLSIRNRKKYLEDALGSALNWCSVIIYWIYWWTDETN